MRRALYFAAGVLFLAVGAIGTVVPLLPTVVFWIVAAWCFGRSDPRLEAWLLRHPTVGPHISSWRERRAISRSGKWAASLALTASVAISAWLLTLPLLLVPVAICFAAAAFIWTRPD
jgi:uncharacterized protein